MVATVQVYEHMKKRLVSQLIECQLKSRSLKEQLKAITFKVEDIDRRNIESYEKYGDAQLELSELYKTIDKTMEMWNEELSMRKEWAEQRVKFELFCAEQLEVTQALELKAKGDMSEAEEKAFQARNRFKVATNKILIIKNHQTEQMCEMESKRILLAFKNIGVDSDVCIMPLSLIYLLFISSHHLPLI